MGAKSHRRSSVSHSTSGSDVTMTSSTFQNHVDESRRLSDTFILPHDHGYRVPHKHWAFYWLSMFWWHNETINVWTHVLPVFWFLHKFFTHDHLWSSMWSGHAQPLLMLYFATAALLAGSASAHLFHSRSKYHHVVWFLTDFLTISIFITGIGIQRYYDSMQLLPSGFPLRSVYIPVLLLVAFAHFFVGGYLFVQYTFWKPRLFMRMPVSLFAAVYLYIPLIPRYMWNEDWLHSGLHSHTKAFLWLTLSGVFMGGQVPERFCPGKFDYIGYGHQLFHICVVFVADNLIDGAYADLAHAVQTPWKGASTCLDLIAPMITLICIDLIAFWYFVRAARVKHE